MTLTIAPSHLAGAVTPPPSKSQAHRYLIAAALAQGESVISNVALSQDIRATIACLTELGAEFDVADATVTVRGLGANATSPLRRMAYPRLDCGESGSTLRFLIPIALAVRGGGVFTGRGRLMERPQGPYETLFKEKGVFWEQKDGVLTVQGQLTPGAYPLPGNVSSQFFTGLLYALPLLNGPSAILPTTDLESADYIAMTCQALETFGVQTMATMSLPPQYHLLGGQTYSPARVTMEADWSQAGFWYAAEFLGNDLAPQGLDQGSLQGDRVIARYVAALAQPGTVDIDVSGCPDLVPPLAAMAALRPGQTTRLVNAGRLRIKESDRLTAVATTLNALGGRVTEGPDFLEFQGVEALTGGTVDSFNDHRIAMMAAVAATRSAGAVSIQNAQAVEKSYPDFWAEYQRLGGNVTWNT